MCLCVHMSETLISDIERHFAPLLSDDMITTRPEVLLFALWPLWLSSPSVHGGIQHRVIGKFIRENHHSLLVPL